MSEWYWRVIALKAVFVITCLTSYIHADDNIQKLPFCDPQTVNEDASVPNDLVLVSTLDGKLTAFSTNNGLKAWDIKTQPLLQSNLHHVELTSGGKWVRLVPSLRGTLYSLSGDTVEPLPFNTDQLLSSSFKYSEDLVVAGSRETLWMGVDAHTGAVVYECSSHGCSGDKEGYDRTVIALRRHSNTVRALDPMTGDEKWNFSVAEHHLALSGHTDCTVPETEDQLHYRVQVAPEGGVAVCRGDSNTAIWHQKLDAPVAGMWRLRSGYLESIDVLWAATKALSIDNYVQTTPPSLYIGLHNQQLYIQESQLYVDKMETAVATKPLPWKLKSSRPLLDGPETNTALQNADPNTLSLITLHGNTGQGNHGFFLYQEEQCDQAVQVTEDLIDRPEIIPHEPNDRIEHHHVHVHVYSLWFWWKEVLLIVISSTLLMNLMIWPRFFAPKFRSTTPLPVNREYIVVEKHYDRPALTNQEYSGRYENDFTPLRCLGRGGFGVVFEARNNIDHRTYAVKRITLPRRVDRRERVLREVRALAQLEHEHIVRYFNAWLQRAPTTPSPFASSATPQWDRDLDGVSLPMTDDYTSRKSSHHQITSAGSSTVDKKGSVMLNLQSRDEALDFEGQLSEPSKRHRSRSCNDSFSIVFDENASREPYKSKQKLKKSLDLTNDLQLPSNFSLSKNLASGDNDDSYIVFENTEDVNHNSKGLSEARNDSSFNKQLAKVKECDVTKDETTGKKKKKGHTRHWSLDMCVKEEPPKMYLYIQMQLCLRDSLHDWLRQNPTVEARGDKPVSLFSQIVSAVEYVHLEGLIHRDLKPSNIFFAPDGKVKVGDFGLVTTMNDSSQDGDDGPINVDFNATKHTYKVGTHLYMSPEQVQGRAYSFKVDIYSLGLVLLELLQPFRTESERVHCLTAARAGHFPPAFLATHPLELEVLKLMLSEDPSIRPTASGVRQRPPLSKPTSMSNAHVIKFPKAMPNTGTPMFEREDVERFVADQVRDYANSQTESQSNVDTKL